MRRLMYILFLLFTAHSSYAQKIRFTDTSNVWLVKSVYTGGPILTSFSNQKITPNYREDTLLKKVYYKYKLTDTDEYILYDYSLKLGDSIWKKHPNSDTFCHIVSKIDSFQVAGDWYKIWYFKKVYQNNISGFNFWDFEVVEGIGSIKNGTDYPLYPTVFEGYSTVLCFRNHGNIITVPGYLSPATCELSVNITPKSSKSISIIPNPANENGRIVFPDVIQSGSVVITNMMGQVVMRKEIVNKEEMTIGSLGNEGVYFYTIIDKLSGQTYKGRFVYQ
ncbi:MAG: T9SS type A sorting domain-containing protein [Bacteroidetes bacterium]|nr:T9SS type A sorting domain-containing protein [Bacteroidota bacterium]